MKTREPLQVWTDNILYAYGQASAVERAEGLSWYPEARRFAVDLGFRYGVRASIVSGVIAALSPMTNWDQNLKDTEAVLKQRGRARVTSYGANKRKAVKILKGADPLHSLGRFKTLSFYECIEGSETQVCIDRHAAAIAYGRNLGDKERGALSGVLYERLQNAYRRAAHAVGLKPSEIQAITWVYWRNHKSAAKKKSVLDVIRGS